MTNASGGPSSALGPASQELTVRHLEHACRPAMLTTFLLSLVVALAVPGLEWSAASVPRPIGPGVGVSTSRGVASDESDKGVCVWAFRGVNSALEESGATWYLTWSTTHDGVVTPRGAQFVPMVRAAANVTPATLAQAEHSGPALLTFNEPDLDTQADMTVDQALSIWPKLMATGLLLASPAVATGAAKPGGWLDRFMKGVEQRHYRVNFIAVHWYGADFQTGAAVAQLKTYLESVHRRYGLPVWLTEYALIDFAADGPIFPTGVEQAAFVTASARMLDSLAFVQRYAWFALPAPSSGPSTGLYAPGPRATVVGQAFART
ncbi:MAG: glycosyl hydrolase [Acidimicrobiales bacterium]|jgi:putative glycosyl hydrolase